MSEWANYIGVIVGVLGAIFGYYGIHTSRNAKALDLRIELKKLENEFDIEFDATGELIEYARRSRVAAMSAVGGARSGRVIQWEHELEKDKEKLRTLKPQHGYKQKSYNFVSQNTLEQLISEIHKAMCELKNIKTKYQDSIASDDKTREIIRVQNENRTLR